MVELEDAGAIASIIGVIAAGIIAWLIWHLDNKRRKGEEEHYKTITQDSLKEIFQIFIDLVRKSKRETRTEEEDDSITIELEDYFQENYRRIRDLLRDARIYLQEWKSLKTEDKRKINQTIESLNWLIMTFYPLDRPQTVKKKRWKENQTELNEKRDQIQNTVEAIAN